jgi:hypothetical protein
MIDYDKLWKIKINWSSHFDTPADLGLIERLELYKHY